MCICMSLCVSDTCRGWGARGDYKRWKRVPDPVELELYVVANLLMWVLGTKL